jgi:hypothetical protein
MKYLYVHIVDETRVNIYRNKFNLHFPFLIYYRLCSFPFHFHHRIHTFFLFFRPHFCALVVLFGFIFVVLLLPLRSALLSCSYRLLVWLLVRLSLLGGLGDLPFGASCLLLSDAWNDELSTEYTVDEEEYICPLCQ